MSDAMFNSLIKAVRGEAQPCNICGVVQKMKNTNVCEKCGSISKRS